MSKIVVLGDSLAAGYGVRPGKGWAYQLADAYPAHRFFHRGIPGDTTDGMLMRWRGYVHEVHPDQMILLGGSNDLLLGRAPEMVLENIRQIHRLCLMNQVQLILLQCPDVSRNPGPYAWFPPSETEHLLMQFQRLREQVLDYARNQALVCLDTLRAWRDVLEEEEIFLADGVHLTEAAHQKIAQFIFQSGVL